MKGDGVPAWKKLAVAALDKLTGKEKSKREGKIILTKKCGTMTRKGRWLEKGRPGASLEAPFGSIRVRESFLQSRQIYMPSISRS